MIVEIPIGNTAEAVYTINSLKPRQGSIVLWDSHSKLFYFCETEEELGNKFVFIGDMDYVEVNDKPTLKYIYNYYAANVNPHKVYPHIKWLLYSDEMKVFDAFSFKNYPLVRYGKQIPRGMSIAKFENRWERDKVIRELVEKEYTCIFHTPTHESLEGTP